MGRGTDGSGKSAHPAAPLPESEPTALSTLSICHTAQVNSTQHFGDAEEAESAAGSGSACI